ncbi:CRISPR-associated endonuclease Cas3'' [Streptomyces sp. WMMC1477]|uniref:CRISPR-associated endonuclease Cas3'' n=1 Tax=Streptomyces sp. WMMC1477 TaxID=3015155 RepID=UPI0022B61A65|nr:CRISPR-associated endonuclease Cas3'' [Streptomyces sp. WMMC1477]MCZ7430386.1 CRISPR-associated endonuclease Cas3'' [Streptomyces sp. WMMC1477]
MVDARLCGKSEGLVEPYPVIGHLIDSAMVCGAVWDDVLSEGQRNRIAKALGLDMSEARRVVMFWAGLHDLGKIMPQFQDMILKARSAHCGFLTEAGYAHDRQADAKAGRTRHENATHAALPQLLTQLGYPTTGGRLAKLLSVQVAQILGGHHGRYPSDSDPRDLHTPLARMPELGSDAWAEQRQQHTEALYEVLGRPAVPDCRAMPPITAAVVAGVVIVSDWIASQEHVIEAQQKVIGAQRNFGSLPSLHVHADNAERMASPLLEEAGLGQAAFKIGGFRDLFPHIRSPYPLQLSVAEGLSGTNLQESGILLVTAPTGDGKTETALYASSLMGTACGSTGLFFALPTQATANQMYGRFVAFAKQNLLDPAQLTLLHGAADLHLPYAEPQPDSAADAPEPRVLSDCEPGAGRDARVSVEAGRWLRSRGRGILAPLAVGTIDQALMGVLPLKRNALRHLGLSGKTVVIDEAHAYDAYTHALLLRLLEWLGALGVPVVLLSATLTGDIACGLVRAYLTGAEPSGPPREVPAPAYPGWVYASARSDLVFEPAEPLRSERERRLAVDVHHVAHTYEPNRADGRLAAVLDALVGVADEGGCVAVICTTVAEAQQTYRALRYHYRSRYGAGYLGWDDRSAEDGEREDAAAGPRLRLLHARFPAHRRAEITAEAESWFGRTDKPGVCRPAGPRGAILVATQVIEQSLDLDFDLVVSDLAPMAMLLQRAGRVWRHLEPPPRRPAWAKEPRLVVLAPTGKDGHLAVPKTWGEVYQLSLLQRTLELLDQRGGVSIAVPGDVQSLVDGVYAEEFVSAAPDKLIERDFRRLADDMARSAMADMVALPPPHRVTSLHPLTTSDADEDLVRTRLGAESVQVLPVFENENGRWLDEECSITLPESGRGRKGRFAMAEVREVLSYVAPLAHGSWRTACGPANEPPAAWSKEPRLARIVLLPQRMTRDGVVGTNLDEYRITYDRVLGLVTQRKN